ncbi:hypothetical protein [Lysobacter sp. FW306-1B-D06B]
MAHAAASHASGARIPGDTDAHETRHSAANSPVLRKPAWTDA